MTSYDYLAKFHSELVAFWPQHRPQWSYVHSDWAPDCVYEYTARALDCCIYTLASNNAAETAPNLIRKQIAISAVEQRQRDAVVFLVRLLYKLNKRDLSWDISADKTQV